MKTDLHVLLYAKVPIPAHRFPSWWAHTLNFVNPRGWRAKKLALKMYPVTGKTWWTATETLTLSWRGLLSYRNQFIDLQSKSMDWFLYDNGLRHERIQQNCRKWILTQSEAVARRCSTGKVFLEICWNMCSNFIKKESHYSLRKETPILWILRKFAGRLC